MKFLRRLFRRPWTAPRQQPHLGAGFNFEILFPDTDHEALVITCLSGGNPIAMTIVRRRDLEGRQ
jgi:hypothetical protein